MGGAGRWFGRRALALASAMAVGPAAAVAQTGPAPVLRWDVAVGSDARAALASVGVARLWPVAANGRLRLGVGARWSAFIGGEHRLSTAEPRLIDAGRIDSLFLRSAWMNAMNAVGHAVVQVSDRWAVGANLDLVGLSWGTTQVGDLRVPGDAATGREAQANPVLWNRLGGGTRDRGSLASEFWLGWDVRRNLRLRAGLNHFVLEQTTPLFGTDGNTRYRRFGNAGFLAVSTLVR